ncbi:MAG: response regulator [Gammaproteobacteria bacterium]|nr:response regulator [Gammaproteobacteria bacterium]
MARKKLKVLFAEDDSMQRQLFDGLLRHYQLEIANSPQIAKKDVETGHEAVAEALKIDYDIIFLDIEMPGKTGIQVLEEIIKEKKDAYVVMISGHSTADNVKKVLELGAKGFIVKPYRINKITTIFDRFMKLKYSEK